MFTICSDILARIGSGGRRFVRRLDRDEEGVISIVAVFAILLLVMILGMVMNVGRHVDGKIRLQNAADASAYSGGVVLSRGMNTLAFTNHLLSDVFALTAFMREARDGNAARYVPDVLAAWDAVGEVLEGSGFPKFERLGAAIRQKTPLEQELVRTFSEWAAASSEQTLPVLEEILAQEMIPEFQRAVVAAYPDIAQRAAMEVARRNGDPDRGRGRMLGVLWRTSATPVGGGFEYFDRTLPVVDPVWDVEPDQAAYLLRARKRRRHYAEMYLGVGRRRSSWRWYYDNWHARSWNDEALVFFDREAKMSQFGSLWRSFTCGQLNRLLDEEYPNANLPHLIRPLPPTARTVGGIDPALGNEYLQRNYTFLAVTYWPKLPDVLPGLFASPVGSDDLAYAEVRMFVPRRRLRWYRYAPGASRPDPMGAIGGQYPQLPGGDDGGGGGGGAAYWRVGRQHVPTAWDLFNQHWTCQLVPATQPCLAAVLQTPPPFPEFAEQEIRLPNLGSANSYDIQRISPH
jgi:hypothetical protein